MEIYHLLNLVFYVEMSLFLKIILLIILLRILSFFIKKRSSRIQHHISEEIFSSLQKQKVDFERKEIRFFYYPSLLLPIMEKFDRRLKEDLWTDIKLELSKKYLLPYARKWTKSSLQKRRNRAARCFALTPLPEDETNILYLLKDSDFLIRSYASVASVRSENVKGVETILHYLASDRGFAHYFYSDLLASASHKVLLFIGELARTRKDHRLHWACLQVLSIKTGGIPLPFLAQDIESENKDICKAAMRVVIRNSFENFEEKFYPLLDHPDEEIRALAAEGLGNSIQENSFKRLEKMLSDHSWNVRLMAAYSLIKRGQITILEKQDKMTNKTAYEVAHYALAFK